MDAEVYPRNPCMDPMEYVSRNGKNKLDELHTQLGMDYVKKNVAGNHLKQMEGDQRSSTGVHSTGESIVLKSQLWPDGTQAMIVV